MRTYYTEPTDSLWSAGWIFVITWARVATVVSGEWFYMKSIPKYSPVECLIYFHACFFLKKGQLSFHDCVYVSVYLSCLFTVGLKFHVTLACAIKWRAERSQLSLCPSVVFGVSLCVLIYFLSSFRVWWVNEGNSSVHHATGTATARH